jgi:hypothetical protein
MNFLDDATLNSEMELSHQGKSKEASQKEILLGKTKKTDSERDFAMNKEMIFNSRRRQLSGVFENKKSTKPKSRFHAIRSEDSYQISKPSTEDGHEKGDSGKCEEIIETLGMGLIFRMFS